MADKSRKQKQVPPLSKKQLERIERAWDAIDEGNPEAATQEAEELLDETEEHPEVRLLLGAALLECGLPGEALRQLRACEDQVDNSILHRYYLASALYENHAIEESEALYRHVLEVEPDRAPPVYGRAQCLELLGRYEEAETEYERAHEIDPEGYPPPIRMKRDAFHRVVEEAARHLPDVLRAQLEEIPVVIEDLPSREILVAESGEEPVSPSVLGLFVGTSIPDRSVFQTESIPPTIFIYQRNLERICQTREELIDEIRKTLYHELGHFLGLSEEELEERGLE